MESWFEEKYLNTYEMLIWLWEKLTPYWFSDTKEVMTNINSDYYTLNSKATKYPKICSKAIKTSVE